MNTYVTGKASALRCLVSVVGLTGLACTGGCGVFGGSSPQQNYAAQVGQYSSSSAPATAKPRLGVPAFAVTEAATAAPPTTAPATQPAPATGPAVASATAPVLGDPAADAMAELLSQSGRFAVIDRAALDRLLRQPPQAGMVGPGVLVHPAPVPGVDLLLIGRVTDLRVTRQAAAPQEGLSLDKVKAAVGSITGKGGDSPDAIVTAECGVVLQFVDPATGEVVLSNDSDFHRSGPPAAFGFVPGPPDSLAASQVRDDDKSRVIRLALDDAVRKSLPKIDRYLQSRPAAAAASPVPPPTSRPAAGPAQGVQPTAGTAARPPVATPIATPAGSTRPATQPAASLPGQKICPTCGHANPAGAKFCDHCGAKLE